jgi:hypothetical protein
MLLSLRARIQGLEPDAVTVLSDRQPELVRVWAMRGTIHLLVRNDAGWMVGLIGPSIIPKFARRREELGLDEEILARSLRELKGALGEGKPLTRDEIVDLLVDRGICIDRRSQAIYHFLAYAGLKGLLFIGPDSPDGETYVLATGDQTRLPEEQALGELAYRYLQGYGPASVEDFASWSGLPAKAAKRGWERLRERGSLADVSVEGRTLGLLETRLRSTCDRAPAKEVVNLLPAFDSLVLGYKDRSLLVPEKYAGEVYHGGQTVPVVLVDGLVAGVWRYERKGKRISIEVRPFEPLARPIKDLVVREAEDIGRLFGLSAAVNYTDR